MLDTHLCFISPSLFCLIGRCSRRWSPGAGVPRRRLLRRRVPRRPGVVWRFPGRRPCLFDRCCFCASLLKADYVYLVSVLRYFLLSLTLCFRAVVFEPSWPLACI